MDNNLNQGWSNPTRRIPLRDEIKRQAEIMEREEKQKKDFEKVKRLFIVYKDRLDKLYPEISNLDTVFNNASTKAQQLQETADMLFRRLHSIRSIKETLIQDIVNTRIAATYLYDNHYPTLSIDLATMVTDPDYNPAEATRHSVSGYLENKELNPLDFEDILDILTEVDNSLPPQNMQRELNNRILNALSLNNVIDAQNQVFKCMLSEANELVSQALVDMRTKFGSGSIRRFFEAADKFYTLHDSDDREQKITSIFEANIDDNYETISYENNRNRFIQIKEENWKKFSDNHSIIRIKTDDFCLCFDAIYRRLQI